MKKYKVNVNGTAYEVEIEEMTGAPTVAAAPVAASAAAPAASGAGESITSPMPGNILAVNVAAGDMVKKGQVLISDTIYERVKDRIQVEPIGEIPLKGKSKGVFVYSVIGVDRERKPEGEEGELWNEEKK